MTMNDFLAKQPVNLSNCDTEPIHIPGRIQPHGALLVLDEHDFTVLQVSDNVLAVLGIAPEHMLRQKLETFVRQGQIDQFRQYAVSEGTKYTRPLKVAFVSDEHSKDYDGTLHYIDHVFILELEPGLTVQERSFSDFYQLIRVATARLQDATQLAELCNIVAVEVRRLTGFDRVMVYQFDHDWNGNVIAEAKLETLEPFLGLHYPASDIPSQARTLYTLNWLRLIADVDYQPSEVIPTANPVTHGALNMTYSVLRSVSPIHIQYLKNMGVQASMSISLLKNGVLWGLIACHHYYEPKYMSYEMRTACEFLGQIFSLQLVDKENSEDDAHRIEVKTHQALCVEAISSYPTFTEGLTQCSGDLLEMVAAQGAALYFDGQLSRMGQAPPAAAIEALLQWLKVNVGEDVFFTDHLAERYPAAEQFREVGSGLLAICISRSQGHYILWFRAEVNQTFTWGGNPEKAVQVEDDGVRLLPRKSFEAWQQTVQLKALPWKLFETEAAVELRSTIMNIVLRKMEELAQLNADLARSNAELDAFAYVASHDLKEPLRGIHNYANFLMEDYTEHLDEEGVAKLKTMVRLTQRMEDLINSLLHFSRVGRVDLSLSEVDLNEVLQQSLEMLSLRIEESGVEIRIPRPLPVIRCDRIRVGEIFMNLISNAIKYNDKPHRWVEIGYNEGQLVAQAGTINQHAITFYVRDNGIGILPKHQEVIFRIFKRLHGADQFGGGTGAGLTIVRKLVERHNGKVWIDSLLGEGSTFYFTLSADGSDG